MVQVVVVLSHHCGLWFGVKRGAARKGKKQRAQKATAAERKETGKKAWRAARSRHALPVFSRNARAGKTKRLTRRALFRELAAAQQHCTKTGGSMGQTMTYCISLPIYICLCLPYLAAYFRSCGVSLSIPMPAHTFAPTHRAARTTAINAAARRFVAFCRLHGHI